MVVDNLVMDGQLRLGSARSSAPQEEYTGVTGKAPRRAAQLGKKKTISQEEELDALFDDGNPMREWDMMSPSRGT